MISITIFTERLGAYYSQKCLIDVNALTDDNLCQDNQNDQCQISMHPQNIYIPILSSMQEVYMKIN